MAEYIDRQAVNNLLYNVYSREVYTHEGTVQRVTGEIDVNELNSIPTADVRENKRGHWIKTEDGDLLCSECGHLTDDWVDIFSPSKRDCVSGKRSPTLSWAVKRPYFCGKCGADMRDEKDG